MAWRLDRSRSHHGGPCSICGSYEDVQMHHVNPIKNIGLSKGSIHLYKGAMERREKREERREKREERRDNTNSSLSYSSFFL